MTCREPTPRIAVCAQVCLFPCAVILARDAGDLAARSRAISRRSVSDGSRRHPSPSERWGIYLRRGYLGLGSHLSHGSFNAGHGVQRPSLQHVWTYDIYQTISAQARPTDLTLCAVGTRHCLRNKKILDQHGPRTPPRFTKPRQLRWCSRSETGRAFRDVPAGMCLAPHHGALSVLRAADGHDHPPRCITG